MPHRMPEIQHFAVAAFQRVSLSDHEPIDIVAEFGEDPDIDEVDAAVRERMQTAMNELKRKRRFPVLG